MKRNIRLAIVALAIMTASSTSALAQSATNNQPKDSTTYRPFQISFVPMLGTNGIESPRIANRLSVNIIAGISKGVGAAEYAGVANITKGNVYGFQYAGVLNMTEDATGCQMAGIVNLTQGNVTGFQGAGIANNTRSVKGVQAAGIVNIAKGDVEGSQLAGIGNMAKNVTGAQLSGIFNLANGNAKTQVAGIFNSAESVKGVQVSGLVNRAKSVGTQIGFVNIADSCSGAAIGIVNIVKTGYHQIELGTDDMLMANLSYRSGIKKLHTIIGASIKPDNSSTVVWGTTFGLGTSVNLSPRTLFDTELLYSQIVCDDKFSHDNKLFRAYLGIDRHLFGKLSLAAGVTANALIYETTNAGNVTRMRELVPYTMVSEKVNDRMHLAGWIGGRVALRLN